MKLSLWDTAGQETYASVTRSYFRGASGALLVFSLTRRSSFLSVTKWLNDLRQIADPDIVVVLVGNKSDLSGQDGQEGKREVETAEAEQWCKQNGVLQYVETSAKSGVGVESAFREVAEKIYENVGKGRYDLNDRRSGVKGPGAGGTRRGGGVSLGMNDAAKKGGSGWSGGCC
jgi:Ras-related protein Rab-2A